MIASDMHMNGEYQPNLQKKDRISVLSAFSILVYQFEECQLAPKNPHLGNHILGGKVGMS